MSPEKCISIVRDKSFRDYDISGIGHRLRTDMIEGTRIITGDTGYIIIIYTSRSSIPSDRCIRESIVRRCRLIERDPILDSKVGFYLILLSCRYRCRIDDDLREVREGRVCDSGTTDTEIIYSKIEITRARKE
jgi:hypothetical protein